MEGAHFTDEETGWCFQQPLLGGCFPQIQHIVSTSHLVKMQLSLTLQTLSV